jgi:hypothetical protein
MLKSLGQRIIVRHPSVIGKHVYCIEFAREITASGGLPAQGFSLLDTGEEA